MKKKQFSLETCGRGCGATFSSLVDCGATAEEFGGG